MHKPSKFLYQLLAFMVVASLGFSCVDDDAPAGPNEAEQKLATNKWINEAMQVYYYWEDELPQAPNMNQDPTDFFESLLSDKDRFSYITPDYEGLINSLGGINKEAGYEFSLARDKDNPNDVLAFVVYVKPDSPAKNAGLKRGDIISHLNGQKLTVENINGLYGDFFENHTISYKRPNAETGVLEAKPDLALDVVVYADNPIFLNKVITTASGNKVGYVVYNFFAQGTISKADQDSRNKDAEGSFDAEMRQVIESFKSQGVNELVLDLRYNGGGAVRSARHLGSLLGRGVGNNDLFYSYQWNDLLQSELESDPVAYADNLSSNFLAKPSNIGNDLSSGTLYVLTGPGTASASELIINGLKPFMNVVLIGDKTVGKNVGSIPIDDTENKNNKYGILPIVFEIFNSQGSSDYAGGFVADYQVADLSRNMKELGDEEEPLLAQALALIEGTPSGARKGGDEAAAESSRRFSQFGSSLDRKPWNKRMIETNVPENLKELMF